MDGLLTFLIFAGAFYLMMRYGCGAHMVHGYDGRGGHSGHGAHEQSVDPVCGMKVDIDQGYGKMYQGALYRFCSKGCLDKFDTDPGQYLNKRADKGGEDMV